MSRKRGGKGPRLTLHPGSWKIVDDKTGFRVWAEETKTEWNGLQVLAEVFEERHPQDYLTGIPDDPSVPFARPKADPIFLDTNEVYDQYFPSAVSPPSPPPPPPPPPSGAIQGGLLPIALSRG